MRIIEQLLGASVLFIFASSAHAMLIVVDPDDFAPDNPIISPYVKVSGQVGDGLVA